jgi:hypothetical protein
MEKANNSSSILNNLYHVSIEVRAGPKDPIIKAC